MAKTRDAQGVLRARRRWRAMLWSMLAITVAAMGLPLLGYVYVGIQQASAQAVEDTNPRANYWRAVRDGNQGYTSVKGPEANVLIQNGGQNWRQYRNRVTAQYGGWALFVVIIAITAFFAIRGRIELEHGRSGKTIQRWTVFERTVHWFTAITFIVLAVTGLSMLFGRVLLIPLLGSQGFAAWASFSITAHNYLGPFFSLGVLLILIMWMRHNIPSKEDIAWFLKGGGIVGKEHPSAGMVNAGEKVWFWLICTVGVAVVITGFVLDFPNYGQTRETMQIANFLHGGLALIWIAVFVGHAYIATIGTEGALEGMTTGQVDVNWAKQHHDLWYEEVEKAGVEQADTSVPLGGAPREQPT